MEEKKNESFSAWFAHFKKHALWALYFLKRANLGFETFAHAQEIK